MTPAQERDIQAAAKAMAKLVMSLPPEAAVGLLGGCLVTTIEQSPLSASLPLDMITAGLARALSARMDALRAAGSVQMGPLH